MTDRFAGQAMNQPTLEQVTGFIDRYRVLCDQLQATRLEQFRSGFERIKSQLVHLRAQSDEQNRSMASDFNIFHLLGVAYLEASTHSALLANLLDPKGTHAQKHLFLHSFLQMCKNRFGVPSLPAHSLDSSRWVVEREKVTPWGNMDLVISARGLGFLLVIENKIYAPEQPDQLQRYHQWMRHRKDRYPDQTLIYLTPSGSRSSTNADCPYFPMSYKQDISSWLKTSLPDVRAPRIKEIILQYLEIVESL